MSTTVIVMKIKSKCVKNSNGPPKVLLMDARSVRWYDDRRRHFTTLTSSSLASLTKCSFPAMVNDAQAL